MVSSLSQMIFPAHSPLIRISDRLSMDPILNHSPLTNDSHFRSILFLNSLSSSVTGILISISPLTMLDHLPLHTDSGWSRFLLLVNSATVEVFTTANLFTGFDYPSLHANVTGFFTGSLADFPQSTDFLLRKVPFYFNWNSRASGIFRFLRRSLHFDNPSNLAMGTRWSFRIIEIQGNNDGGN